MLNESQSKHLSLTSLHSPPSPLDGSVHQTPIHSQLPPGAVRLAITVNGDETDEDLQKIKELDPAFIFLNTSPELSTLHASRRFFEILKSSDIDTSVIHHFLTDSDDSNALALDMGMTIGGLLTDGLGDGLMIEQTCFPSKLV